MSNSKPMIEPSSDGMQLLFYDIAVIIKQAHQHVRQAVNQAMVQSYWQIGRQIVEHEQQGQQRAAYGKQQLQLLSKQLTSEFGKGFDASNLRNMRSFYLCSPKCDAVSHKLSWTHYRKLIRVESPKARAWYQQEAIEQSWSARALDRPHPIVPVNDLEEQTGHEPDIGFAADSFYCRWRKLRFCNGI